MSCRMSRAGRGLCGTRERDRAAEGATLSPFYPSLTPCLSPSLPRSLSPSLSPSLALSLVLPLPHAMPIAMFALTQLVLRVGRQVAGHKPYSEMIGTKLWGTSTKEHPVSPDRLSKIFQAASREGLTGLTEQLGGLRKGFTEKLIIGDTGAVGRKLFRVRGFRNGFLWVCCVLFLGRASVFPPRRVATFSM